MRRATLSALLGSLLNPGRVGLAFEPLYSDALDIEGVAVNMSTNHDSGREVLTWNAKTLERHK